MLYCRYRDEGFILFNINQLILTYLNIAPDNIIKWMEEHKRHDNRGHTNRIDFACTSGYGSSEPTNHVKGYLLNSLYMLDMYNIKYSISFNKNTIERVFQDTTSRHLSGSITLQY